MTCKTLTTIWPTTHGDVKPNHTNISLSLFRTGNHLTSTVVRVCPSKILVSFQYGSGAINTLKGHQHGGKLAYLETDL